MRQQQPYRIVLESSSGVALGDNVLIGERAWNTLSLATSHLESREEAATPGRSPDS
jgi:hypothetical protein